MRISQITPTLFCLLAACEGGRASNSETVATCNPACSAGQSCVVVVATGQPVCSETIGAGATNPGPTAPGGATLGAAPGASNPGNSTPPPATPSGGTLSCAQIIQCLSSCNANDNACGQACVQRGDAQAQQMLSALTGCLQRYGCQDTSCLQQNCGGEYSACSGSATAPPAPAPGPTGGSGLSCQGFEQCAHACASGDQACTQACAKQLSPGAADTLNAIETCAQQNGCQDTTCLESHCSSQLAACS
jgi:hypothetical protein